MLQHSYCSECCVTVALPVKAQENRLWTQMLDSEADQAKRPKRSKNRAEFSKKKKKARKGQKTRQVEE